MRDVPKHRYKEIIMAILYFYIFLFPEWFKMLLLKLNIVLFSILEPDRKAVGSDEGRS